jgi:signal transduction histidine kinase
MALRTRLAVLYTSIVGGILLIFGVAVYAAVSYSLLSQVDTILYRTVNQFYPHVLVDVGGELVVDRSANLDLPPGLLFQLWDRNRELVVSNIRQYNSPFDPSGLQSGDQLLRDVNIELGGSSFHLRSITVPLVIGENGRYVGSIQVATSLAVVDATQKSLLLVLLIGVGVSMAIAGVAGWYSTRQALAPLGDVTNVALQITRADDLSRRIPYSGPLDEVGQLIKAFNQTLSRVENLFNTQRRFLADVGHELRTPLTVIKGNVDLMRRLNCTDDESMEGIENEVNRLTRLVGDLLLLAQAESGKLPLDFRQVELDAMVLEVVRQMSVLVKGRQSLKIGAFDQVVVCGDQDRLKQVLVNLIGNAIKYTPDGGEIVVGLSKEVSEIHLSVKDNGPGIPAEDLPHVFERFYRAEKSRTRQTDGKGFGLGLAIAYWIVRNHRGEIEVKSILGHGAEFIVKLPLAETTCSSEEMSISFETEELKTGEPNSTRR